MIFTYGCGSKLGTSIIGWLIHVNTKNKLKSVVPQVLHFDPYPYVPIKAFTFHWDLPGPWWTFRCLRQGVEERRALQLSQPRAFFDPILQWWESQRIPWQLMASKDMIMGWWWWWSWSWWWWSWSWSWRWWSYDNECAHEHMKINMKMNIWTWRYQWQWKWTWKYWGLWLVMMIYDFKKWITSTMMIIFIWWWFFCWCSLFLWDCDYYNS